MKMFVILFSCLACCVTAGRFGLTQRLSWLDSIHQGQQAVQLSQGHTPRSTSERQQFLLDVLLQVQKPLVNTQLIQLGQELVTDPNMYADSNDEILQKFLQQASNQEILGRSDVYSPVDTSNIRQLVGLQRYFVAARDYSIFQRNVVYARLYFNPVMFVDALSLAIRDRPDTQDLVIPPVNEILPELYYDDNLINAVQNVDYNNLITQATRTHIKPSLFDVFGLGGIGSLLQGAKYGPFNPLRQRKMQIESGRKDKGIVGLTYTEVQGEIALQVGEQDALSTYLTNDVDLNVALNNIVIDQLVQTVTEGIEGGQQIGGIGSDQQYYQQGQYYSQGQYNPQGQYYQQEQYDETVGKTGRYNSAIGGGYRARRGKQDTYGHKLYGQSLAGQEGMNALSKQNVVKTNELPQVDVNSQRLLRAGRRYRVNAPNSRYSNYVNPFYHQQSQHGYNDQEYGSTYASSYGRKPNQGGQYGYYGQEYGSTYPYGSEEDQETQYNNKIQEYPHGGQKYQGPQYGYKNQEYPYGRGQNQGAQYGYNDQKYGSSYPLRQNQGDQHAISYNGQAYSSYYPQQNQGTQYSYKYPIGRQQNQGSQYGYTDQEYGSSYLHGRQQNQGAQYGNKGQQYGSYYDQEQNQGALHSYKGQEYGYGTKSQQKYQRQQQQIYLAQPYGQENIAKVNDDDDEAVVSRQVRDTRHREESGRHYRSGDNKLSKYRYTEQYRELEGLRGEIMRNIAVRQQLSYSRRGEILLQSIQELAARLNIQRIVETIEGTRYQQQQYLQAQNEIGQIMQQLRALIEQVRQETGLGERSEEALYIVASIINGRYIVERQKLSTEAQRYLQALQQQIQRIVGNKVGQLYEVTPLALLAGNLRNPVTQQAILSFAQLIDEYRQQLKPYTQSQLSGNGDITVQNVQIDPLVTYTETADADLVNLIDQQLLQSNSNNLKYLGKKVVARQHRLNYEPFTISMNIQSEYQQESEIRILLGPKIDYNANHVSLVQNRQNFIVIDAFVQQLQVGDNNIQRNSVQFNGYSGDVSTISQIYRQIMTGQKQKQQSGAIRQLPQHLLLPRGTTVNGGLPVQVMVVVTPLAQQSSLLLGDSVYAHQISGFGIAGVGVDQLPLGYPLDRQIIDEQLLNVPNILTTETVILYDSRIPA